MSEIDVKVIQSTQKSLGKYIKKPQLTEKLLRKPPFRFLHDITNTVIKETGFLKGLYSERELVSENVKEKEEKIAFLNKLINATKTITEKNLTAKPTKIIAGLEPTETNLLLQAIGYALENQLDSSQYVAQLVKSDKKSKSETNVTDKRNRSKEKSLKPGEKRERKVPLTPTSKSQETIKATKTDKIKISKSTIQNAAGDARLKDKSKTPKEKAKSTPRENKSTKSTPRGETKKLIVKEENSKPKNEDIINEIEEANEVDEPIISKPKRPPSAKSNYLQSEPAVNLIENGMENGSNEDTIEVPQIQRVKSARPKTGILKVPSEELVQEVDLKETTTIEVVKVEKSKEETESLADLSSFSKPLARPRSSLRPPSVRPSSARPGAPRLRTENIIPEGEVIPLGKVNVIVENFNSKEAEEEETVTIQSVPEPEFQMPSLVPMPTDKGHLVEQILQQINQEDVVEHAKHTVNIEWEQDGLRSRNATTKEIEQLKSAIQTLTKTANPLGKLINYLHEDYEAMHSELQMWTNSARQTMIDVTNQKRLSDESNKPLQMQLQEIEENIVKHQQQINAIYGNISRNESRIRDLLIK